MAVPQALLTATYPPAVLRVARELKARGHHTFLVGGCVRDLLRGQAPKDWDLATSATPDQVIACFKKVIPTGIEHGTVTVVVERQHVEVTTFRAESDYQDGRRPSKVEFHSDIWADLSRRDFTINAMAFDPIEPRQFVDPFEGLHDLGAKVVRCVRDATERFSEDGLRPLRAVRFATVLEFSLDPATEAAVAPTVPIFRKVAQERVNQEFTKLLLAGQARLGLELLARTTLLDAFLPEARAADFAAVGRARADLALRLAVLLARVSGVREVLLRLKYPNQVADDASRLVGFQALPPGDASPAELRRWLAKVDASRAPALLELAEALGADVAALRAAVTAMLAARPPLDAKALALDGQGIMQALGVGPSRVVGEASRHLLDVVLEDPTRNTPDGLRAALKAWFSGRSHPT